jgi:carbamoyltransferase
VKLNQRIREIEGVEGIFVYPNMGDGGCATGAALLASGKRVSSARLLENVYHGPEYSDGEIVAALKSHGLLYHSMQDIEPKIATLLSNDHIVARFAGRMEYGPRALGNRSILYPASDPAVNRWLNTQLGRTEFMPFAPAVLAEHAGTLFHNLSGCEKAAEFMTITFDCTERMKRLCPAAVHIDETARPQLVSPSTNPSFCRVLEAYYDLTGVPAVINTSFNMHEEPIVCSPEDAIRAFLQGNIDFLAIGSYLVPHPQLTANQSRRSELTSKGNESDFSGSGHGRSDEAVAHTLHQ